MNDLDTQGGRMAAALSTALNMASFPSVLEQYVSNHNTLDKYLDLIKEATNNLLHIKRIKEDTYYCEQCEYGQPACNSWQHIQHKVFYWDP